MGQAVWGEVEAVASGQFSLLVPNWRRLVPHIWPQEITADLAANVWRPNVGVCLRTPPLASRKPPHICTSENIMVRVIAVRANVGHRRCFQHP